MLFILAKIKARIYNIYNFSIVAYADAMITCKCKTEATLLLKDMTPFQGELKKRSKKDLEALGASLKSDGLLMPIAVWAHEDKMYILDGHGRREALLHLAITEDAGILEQRFPVLVIEAESDEQARKSLLQISSSYGRVNRQGLLDFTAPLIDYHAPIIRKYHKTVVLDRQEADRVVIKISVPKEKAGQIKQILGSTDGVIVL